MGAMWLVAAILEAVSVQPIFCVLFGDLNIILPFENNSIILYKINLCPKRTNTMGSRLNIVICHVDILL
uniref:Uncharacterized protein n=1 Tax=Anguilla anguilla TaxID=7936 RepID=A0A0E9QNT6_ANGAN